MCSVYAHFLINVTLQDRNRTFEICNFLGEKIVRRVTRPDEVNATIFTTLKKRSSLPDDISLVSRSTIGYEVMILQPYEFISRNKYKPIDLHHNKKAPSLLMLPARQTMVTFVMCFNQQSFNKALKLKKKMF
ncbi:hypothetical protein B9Z55_023665 [Caenorhabditis nigoni]|uniref:Uncharacterized protein n=1 Tax=Caenorhabditis nigoni TaxID=1611254 RepID=A0A2G5SR63_9PELO|nr:hypothetical protein B9Z55_023665 [Caenorhabditis nigoni]